MPLVILFRWVSGYLNNALLDELSELRAGSLPFLAQQVSGGEVRQAVFLDEALASSTLSSAGAAQYKTDFWLSHFSIRSTLVSVDSSRGLKIGQRVLSSAVQRCVVIRAPTSDSRVGCRWTSSVPLVPIYL